jgi:hypothetical protein
MMDFLYPFLSLFGLVVTSLVVGLAATPSVWLVRMVFERANGMGDWGGALLIGLSIGAGYVLFGLTSMILVVILRLMLGLRNREGSGFFYQPAVFI